MKAKKTKWFFQSGKAALWHSQGGNTAFAFTLTLWDYLSSYPCLLGWHRHPHTPHVCDLICSKITLDHQQVRVILLTFAIILFVLCECVDMPVAWLARGHQRIICGSCFFPSTMWVTGPNWDHQIWQGIIYPLRHCIHYFNKCCLLPEQAFAEHPLVNAFCRSVF